MLKQLKKSCSERKIPVIDDATGRLIEALCFLKKPESILEIGCGTGYSTYFILKSFKKFYAGRDNNLKKKLYAGIDLNKKRIDEASLFINSIFPELVDSGMFDLRFLHGNALKILPRIECMFDFVFIDAAKFEYPEYLVKIKNKLKPGCLIIADNIFYSNKIFSKQLSSHDSNSVKGLKKYISMVTDKKNYTTEFINLADGIAITVYDSG